MRCCRCCLQYREYVQRLRNKSSLYKKNRSVLAELRSETGILTRTESILQKQNQSVDKRVSALENRKGVSGVLFLNEFI